MPSIVLTSRRLSTRMSFVNEYVPWSSPSTCSSSKNFLTASSHDSCQSSCCASAREHNASLAACTHPSKVGCPAVRKIRPENRLLTRFSRILIVSTRVVTPTTAMPLCGETTVRFYSLLLLSLDLSNCHITSALYLCQLKNLQVPNFPGS